MARHMAQGDLPEILAQIGRPRQSWNLLNHYLSMQQSERFCYLLLSNMMAELRWFRIFGTMLLGQKSNNLKGHLGQNSANDFLHH